MYTAALPGIACFFHFNFFFHRPGWMGWDGAEQDGRWGKFSVLPCLVRSPSEIGTTSRIAGKTGCTPLRWALLRGFVFASCFHLASVLLLYFISCFGNAVHLVAGYVSLLFFCATLINMHLAQHTAFNQICCSHNGFMYKCFSSALSFLGGARLRRGDFLVRLVASLFRYCSVKMCNCYQCPGLVKFSIFIYYSAGKWWKNIFN